MRNLLILLSTLLFSWSSLGQSLLTYSRAKVHLDAGAHSIAQLSRLGIATDHGEHKKNTVFISDLSSNEISLAKQAGFEVEVIIDDVSKYYREQNNAAKTTAGTTCDAGPAQDIPLHFHLGSYAGYFTYTEMLSILDSMQTLYPGLISARQAIDTFHSIEGRQIFWLRLSNNPSVEQPAKPQMLFTALHHAREPGTISTTIYYLWYMLEHYATDPMIKAIIDNTELYFVPCVNPDGYLYNISTNPAGGGLWRKNRRLNADGTYGVDLNRNYGYNWGYDDIGSSPTTTSETYRGTSGASEPEIQAMEWLANQHHFKIAINYHTYGNDLIYPWGYIGSLQTPDSAQFQAYAAYLTQYTPYRYGTGDQTVGYVTNGDSDDWGYGEQVTKAKEFSTTPETGLAENGFYTPIGNILPDCQNNLRTNIDAATLLLPLARVTSTDERIITQPSGYLHYSLQRLGFPDTATFTVTVTSLSPNLTITGAPAVFSSLSMLQKIVDSVGYTIAASTANGQALSYELKVYNGYYYMRDTVVFNYGKWYTNATPSTDNFSDWSNTGWGTCNTFYYTAPTSLTTSITGCTNYPDNSVMTLQMNAPVDLTTAHYAYLYFYARWGIESSYDYLQVAARPVGSSTWTPLCGRYTKPGTTNQLHSQPIYDGQQPNWLQEEMDLSDYLGQTIQLKYELVSDPAVDYMGFFLDNVNVIAIIDSPTAVANISKSAVSLNVFPDPASTQVTIGVNGLDAGNTAHAVIYDQVGRRMMEVDLKQGNTSLDINTLSNGIYYIKTTAGGAELPVKKLVVSK